MAKAVEHVALERHGLSDEQLIAVLRNMLLQRALDTRAFQLNRQGKIPFALGSEGHEALQAGASLAFERGRDVLVSYYRDMGLLLGTGTTALEILLSLFARVTDRSGGRQFPTHLTNRDIGLMTVSSIIGAHLTHGVGTAFAFKYRKEAGRVVLATFGEGSTSQGEWHESINFAAVHRLPIVFLCENNRLAISVPQEKQMAVQDVASKASGYGMPGDVCDGFDPLATYAAIRAAFDRARAGGGPTLVEAKCYRFLSHSTDDDDRTYRDRTLVNAERKNDPLPRFERRLLDAGVIAKDDLSDLRKSVMAETNEATDAAEAAPYPAAGDLYTNVYEGGYQPWL